MLFRSFVKEEATAVEYLKMLALSRLYFENIQHIQSSWVTPGLKTCQMGLRFGGNDVGSIMIEENVVSAAGTHHQATEETLRRLIRENDVKNAIVFCNRKKDVAILQGSLKKHGFNAGALHGDMSQPARMETLEKFKQGEIQILVASDVAARGLDINDMSHVFNFDVPFSPEDYVHRIGRTGRAGKTGHSFTLATPDEGHLVEAIEKLIGTTIPRIEIEGLDAVAFEEGDGRRRGRGRGRGGRGGSEREIGRAHV